MELNEKNIFKWVRDKIRDVKNKRNPNYLQSGGFYTLRYDALGWQEQTLAYFDSTPMILVLQN